MAAELVPAKAQSASALALATLKQSKGGILQGLLSRSSSLDISEPDQHASQIGSLGRSHSAKATGASKHGHAGQKAAAGPDDAMLQSLDKGEGPLTTSRSLRQKEQERRVVRASLDDAGVVVVVISKGLDRVAEDDREGQGEKALLVPAWCRLCVTGWQRKARDHSCTSCAGCVCCWCFVMKLPAERDMLLPSMKFLLAIASVLAGMHQLLHLLYQPTL